MSSIVHTKETRVAAALTKAAVVLIATVTLGACSSVNGTFATEGSMLRGPASDKYPVQVASAREGLTIVVKPHVFALGRDDKNRVAWLAETYKHVGHGEIWVVAPTGSANSAASIGAAAEIAKVMVDRGIKPTSIKMNSYQAASTDDEAPITVLFKRYHAYAQDCKGWRDNVAFTPMNASSKNLGCASQSNLAAMVEDPYDLVEPRGIDPADAARRATVFGKYRAGESTQSQRTSDESGAVSEIGDSE